MRFTCDGALQGIRRTVLSHPACAAKPCLATGNHVPVPAQPINILLCPTFQCADNSRRAFYREFRKVIEASDVIIQVLDARDPAACRCEDVERYVRSLGPNKRIVLLLNKIGEPGGCVRGTLQ